MDCALEGGGFKSHKNHSDFSDLSGSYSECVL